PPGRRLDGVARALVELEQAREQHPRVALEPRVAIGELEPGGRPGQDLRPVERGDRALDGERADVLPVAARVPVEGTPDAARDPGRELEPGQVAVAAGVDQLQEVRAAADLGRRAVELDLLDGV